MYRTLAWVGVIIVIILGLGIWLVRDNSDQAEVTPSPSPAVNYTVSMADISFTYEGAEGFDLAEIPGQVLVSSYIPPCDIPFNYCLYYRGDKYKDTNFDSAGLRISNRSDLSTSARCLNTPPAGYTLRPKIRQGEGYSTSLFAPLGNAATGHLSEGEIYRLSVGGACYEFEARIGTSQITNYEPGTVKEFTEGDRASILVQLRNMLRQITITATDATVIFPEPSNARLDYVKGRLALAGIDPNRFTGLLSDRRLVRYPRQSVTYREPNWKAVEDKLYSPALVQKGKNYLQAHQAAFDQAEQMYGVNKETLVALIGMETDFGDSSGRYGIFSALYSRMLQWPETTWRAQADQLTAFSIYCIRSNIDCFNVKGSYAGAFGIVQFMPDSLLAYGIDGDKNGVVDLHNPVDAIPSAANYLKEHGWAENPEQALARYYGSPEGYPRIVLHLATLLEK